jgi:hypothetical protein
MGVLLLLILAEIAVSSALSQRQLKARQIVLQKWKEGSLSEEELYRLKRAKWFQQVWRPTYERVSSSKKNN